MERRPSLRYGATEKDIPSLDQIPQMNCSRDRLFEYFDDEVARFDGSIANLEIFGSSPSRKDKSFESYLRNLLRAERLMAEGQLKQFPDGTWVAVKASDGIVATAASRFDLREKARPLGQYFGFCLRQVYAVVSFASQASHNVGASKLPYFPFDILCTRNGLHKRRRQDGLYDTGAENCGFDRECFHDHNELLHPEQTWTTGGLVDLDYRKVIVELGSQTLECEAQVLNSAPGFRRSYILGHDVISHFRADVNFDRDPVVILDPAADNQHQFLVGFASAFLILLIFATAYSYFS
jgi:hypothetical protein